MKKILFFACTISLMLYVSAIQDITILFENPEKVAYLQFNHIIGRLMPIVILFVFLSGIIVNLLWSNISKNHENPMYMWGGGFLGTLILILGLVLYVNPHGIFPWNYFSSSAATTAYIPTAARTQKIMLFNNLETPPELVILGSSRAFTISSSYVEWITGLRTFNMAVNGGGPLDFLTFGRYIFSKEPVHPPSILIVELVVPSLNVHENLMPVSMIPYLDQPQKRETYSEVFYDIVSLQSVSDALFQLSYARLFPKRPAMSFEPDGTGIRTPITERQYQTGLKRVTKKLNTTYLCDSLSPRGMQQLEQLISIAAENKTAILFYRSPLNSDFLDNANINHPRFKKCETLFNAYMTDLKTKHPNVFFHDLTYYKQIGELRWNGYNDAHHLKPIGANLLIDALSLDIIQAHDWATHQREIGDSVFRHETFRFPFFMPPNIEYLYNHIANE